MSGFTFYSIRYTVLSASPFRGLLIIKLIYSILKLTLKIIFFLLLLLSLFFFIVFWSKKKFFFVKIKIFVPANMASYSANFKFIILKKNIFFLSKKK